MTNIYLASHDVSIKCSTIPVIEWPVDCAQIQGINMMIGVAICHIRYNVRMIIGIVGINIRHSLGATCD